MTKDVSQVQQQGMDAWRKTVEEQTARLGAMVEEIDLLQQKQVEQTTQALDEYSKLVRESFTYAAQLTAQWRRLALESSKRTAEMMAPRS